MSSSVVMFYLFYFIDIVVNIVLLVFLHVFCIKVKNKKSNSTTIKVLKNIVRVFHYPILITLAFRFITDKDNVLLTYLDIDILYYLIKIRIFSFLFCGLLCIFNFTSVICDSLINKINNSKNDEKLLVVKIIKNIINALVILIAVGVILSIFDIHPSNFIFSVCTPLTLFSLILKNTLEDVFNGFFLILTNLYKKGDLVYVQDKDIEGYVNKIGLKAVEIKTIDNKVVLIKNSIFTSSLIVNKSKNGFFSLSFIVDLKYSDLNSVYSYIENIKDHVKKKPYYNQNEKIIVVLKEIQSDSVTLNPIVITNIKKDDKNGINVRHELMKELITLANNFNCQVTNIHDSEK